MKKVYLLIATFLVAGFTISAVNAESKKTPINPNNTFENKIEVIDQMVIDGELDKTTGEEIKKELENCDGTGNKRLGQKYNLHFGRGQGNGLGKRHNQR